MSNIVQLEKLFGTAVVAESNGASVCSYRAQFHAVLRFILAHPEMQSDVLILIDDKLSFGADTTQELMEFLAYSLRWPQIASLAEAKLRTATDLRHQSFLKSVLNAARGEWDDNDLFNG